jgi:hypothetical protein
MIRHLSHIIAATLLASTALAQPCPTWTALPEAQGPNGRIRSLVVHNNHLIAHGEFTSVNGIPAAGIAEFDGSVWTPMSNGWPNTAGYEDSLAVSNGRLHCSGPTTSATPNAGRIWDGVQWNPWPTTGTLGGYSLALFPLSSNELLVEGGFTFSVAGGGTMGRRFALWDGAAFHALGTEFGPNRIIDATFPYINSAVRFEGQIYMAGGFTAIARGNTYNTTTVPATRICRFDGSQFQPLANGGLNGTINALAVFQGELYVAGDFTATQDGAVQLNRIASYYANAWHRVGGGVSSQILNLFVADDGTGEKLHIITNSGSSTAYNAPQPTTDTVAFRGVVRWNGGRFSAYGASISSGINEGPAQVAVRLDKGTGEALYFAGLRHYGGPTPGYGYLSRWGPGASPDTDGDGILDTWEQNGIDGDCNGTIDLNLPAMGANWQRKDVFVEVDSMVGRAPAQATLDRVVAAFAAAPNALVNNPNGQNGVNLHLVVDLADQNIPFQNFPNSFVSFHPLKHQYFGNPADRASPNMQAILDAKQRVFRYCIFGNTYGTTSSSGLAEVLGNDFMVTLGGFPTPGGTPDEQAATFMHELGHTLGLFHGGHQSDERYFNYKPNYHSVMNYSWQLASNRPGWTLDYSRQALPNLDEFLLNELNGIGGAAGAVVIAGPLPGHAVPETGTIDWDGDGTIELASTADVNRLRSDYPASIDVLEGSEDWSRLKYNFRNSPNYASGNSPDTTENEDHMTPDLDAALDAIYAPAVCAADLGTTGGAPGHDGTLDNNDFIVFIDYFFAHNPIADMGSTGGVPGADNQWNNNDFVVFINRFFQGC